MHQRTSKI